MNSAMVIVLSVISLALSLLGISSVMVGSGAFTAALYVGIGLLGLTVLLTQGVALHGSAKGVFLVCRWAIIAPLLLTLGILVEGMSMAGAKAFGDTLMPFIVIGAAAALLALPEIKWLVRNLKRPENPRPG